MGTRDEPAVLEELTRWAERHDAVRALLLYSSRADPQSVRDAFSDYDVLFAVCDVPAFYADPSWLGAFGRTMSVFRNPLGEHEGFPTFLFIVHYDDGVKVDFAFVDAGYLAGLASTPRLPRDLDHGYRALVDKDALAAALPPPTHTAYWPAPPDEASYLALVDEVLNDAAYVAKALSRGDLLPAKLSLDHVIKHECLGRMLEWSFGLETGWRAPSRRDGRGLRARLDPAQYAELERTYVGAGIEENWEALFGALDLVRRVADEVGKGLGFEFPEARYRRALAYLSAVRGGTPKA